jgi:YidC/Oxa1 family membrane protein insertase
VDTILFRKTSRILRKENQARGMEKKAILAIILTFLVIMLWGVIQSKFFPPPAQRPPAREAQKEPGVSERKTPELGMPAKETKPPGETLPSVAEPTKVIPKQEVLVETPNYWAVITSDGARLKEFRLKKYLDRVVESTITVKLRQLVQSILGRKVEVPQEPEPLNLVNTTEAEGLPLGLTMVGSAASLFSGNWEVDKGELRLMGKRDRGELTFTKTLENGLKVIKRFKFESQGDVIDLDVELQNTSSGEISGQLGLEWVGKVELKKLADNGNKDFGLKYAYLKGQKVETKDLGGAGRSGCTPGCSAPKTAIDPFEFSDRGEIKWFSFGADYFVAMLIPPTAQEGTSLGVKGIQGDLVKADIAPPPFSIFPGQTIKFPYRVYLGPREIGRLKALGAEAEKLVNFGFFSIVANPLLWLLNLTHKITGNYGIDIIILSILIKIIFIPLTQISYKSMKEMQKVQPEMNRLREMYKNDKARLQQEMMMLYKRRKINPLSGCLPMAIQIPVFIALYNVLLNTFEVRHAPFFLWIKDLSAKDPIYLTPLVMGVTMVLQQKMTPTAADPTQAKMFMLMPVMFTFLFLSFPSGLVLYWLVNNVLSIAHQYYMTKMT